MNILSLAISASKTATDAAQVSQIAGIDPTPRLPLIDVSPDHITTEVIRSNSKSGDGRLSYLMERLTTHLHKFARETRLSTEEWEAALNFCVECGKRSDERRNVSLKRYCFLDTC